MSELLRLLNHLKVEARLDILTDAQKLAYDRIMHLWRFPGHVNLCGESGVGKTMLGWVVSRTLDIAFFSGLRYFRESTVYPLQKVVIDNHACQSKAVRAVLAEAQLRNSRRTLVITTEPNRIGLPVVALKSPERRDIDVIYHNLSLLEYYSAKPIFSNNLWDIIYSVL